MAAGVTAGLALLKELDVVALVRAMPEKGLVAGEVGTIVAKLGGGEAFMVEFVDAGGRTTALETFMAADLRPARPDEIAGRRTP